MTADEEAGAGWSATPMAERSKILLKASQLIMQKQKELAAKDTE